MNMRVQISLRDPDYILLDNCQRVTLLDYVVTQFLIF